MDLVFLVSSVISKKYTKALKLNIKASFVRYGRRTAFLTAGLSQIVILNLLPLAENFYAYCIFQIVIGGLQQGCYIMGFIISKFIIF